MGIKPNTSLQGNRISIVFPDEETAGKCYLGIDGIEFDLLEEKDHSFFYSVCMLKYYDKIKSIQELFDDMYKKVESFKNWLDHEASDYPKIKDLNYQKDLVSFRVNKVKGRPISNVHAGTVVRAPVTIFDTAVYFKKDKDGVLMIITNYNEENKRILNKLKLQLSDASNGNMRHVSFKSQLADIALRMGKLRGIEFDPNYPIPKETIEKIKRKHGDEIDVENFQVSNEIKVKKDVGKALDLKAYPDITQLLDALKGKENILVLAGIENGVTVKIIEEAQEPMKITFYPPSKEVIKKTEYKYVTEFIDALADTSIKTTIIQMPLSKFVGDEVKTDSVKA
jgi:hypothetical protein